MQAAVAAAEGLPFSGSATPFPENDDACNRLNVEAMSQIIGAGVVTDTSAFFSFLGPTEGYVVCQLQSTDNPDVSFGTVHLAPDLNGDDNWRAIGTLEGAFDLPGLGDSAIWSDGSRSDNLTNPTQLQLQVDENGQQSLIRVNRNDPQLEIVG